MSDYVGDLSQYDGDQDLVDFVSVDFDSDNDVICISIKRPEGPSGQKCD